MTEANQLFNLVGGTYIDVLETVSFDEGGGLTSEATNHRLILDVKQSLVDQISEASNYVPILPLKIVLNTSTRKYELRFENDNQPLLDSTSVETGSLLVTGLTQLKADVKVAGALEAVGNVISNNNFMIKGSGRLIANSIGAAATPELSILRTGAATHTILPTT